MRAGVRRPILALTRDGKAAPHAEAAAGVRHRRRVAAVRQEVRVRARGVRRPEAPRRDHRHGGQRRRAFRRPRLGQDRLARHALLQQQLRRLHPGIGVEPFHEDVVADDVGQRDERHALVMREERADDLGASRRRRRRLVRRLLCADGVVDRFVEPEAAVQADAREAIEVRRGRRPDRRGRQRPSRTARRRGRRRGPRLRPSPGTPNALY